MAGSASRTLRASASASVASIWATMPSSSRRWAKLRPLVLPPPPLLRLLLVGSGVDFWARSADFLAAVSAARSALAWALAWAVSYK